MLRLWSCLALGFVAFLAVAQFTNISEGMGCAYHIPLSTAPYVQPLRQKIKTFEKLGTLGFWTSTTSWKHPFCLIPSKNHFFIFATPYRRCFRPPATHGDPQRPKFAGCRIKKAPSYYDTNKAVAFHHFRFLQVANSVAVAHEGCTLLLSPFCNVSFLLLHPCPRTITIRDCLYRRHTACRTTTRQWYPRTR